MEYKDVTDVLAVGHNILDWAEAKVSGSWLHRWFWHSVHVKWYAPPVHFATSWELDHPFRKSHAIVLRYSFRRSAVLGKWGKTGYDEDTALLEATIHGRQRRQDEREAWDETVLKVHDPATDGNSGVLGGEPGLRVRATFDAGIDG